MFYKVELFFCVYGSIIIRNEAVILTADNLVDVYTECRSHYRDGACFANISVLSEGRWNFIEVKYL